jgi:hypothetical protein
MPLILGTNSIKDTGYDVDNSMRLDSASSSRLSKTFSGASNSRTTFTISAWFKRSKLGATQDLISAYRSSDGFQTDIMRFGSTDDFEFYAHSTNSSGACDLQTNRLFRDVGAWYHVVVRVDTTQGTASNRVRIYVNGTQETSFSSSSYMNQNGEVVWGIGSGVEHTIGAVSTSNYFGGYVAEVVYLDGQSLDADSFGEFDSDSPTIWKPKDVSGLTFANNSFYLDFGNSSELGTDVSGRSNSFTENNIDAQDQSTDTCTNNFATLNPRHHGTADPSSNGSFKKGNLGYSSTQSGSPYPYSLSTIAVSQGKWYAEFKITQVANSSMVGINDGQMGYSYLGNTGNIDVSVFHDGAKYPGGSSYGSSFSDDDICGVALDLDNMKVYFHKNGTYFNSGDPTSGSTGTGAQTVPTSTVTGVFHFGVGDSSSGTPQFECNFGSPPYSISSGNADANGYGNFEYAVPSGYYALNTKNLSEYG